MKKDELDPRYDPLYQRGYAVSPGSAESDSPATRRQAAPPAESTADAELQASSPAPSAFEQLGLVGSVPSQARPVVTTEIFEDEASPAGKVWAPNPYVILLWVLGLALVMAGTTTTFWAVTTQPSGSFDRELIALQQFLWILAPSATTVGMGIVAGLLFWHAIAWRRALQ